MSAVAASLRAQWSNPSDITAVLMIIGGDVVQTALAQSTGAWIVPVCFSFGWVAYSFMALVSVLGDGRLMPQPDYPVKVFNLDSGYARENKNWIIGRLMRDHEATISRQYPLRGKGFRIAVFEAQTSRAGRRKFPFSKMQLMGVVFIIAQLVIASIPIMLYRDWSIMLVTSAGTLLSLSFGALPQWTVEKLTYRTQSQAIYGLTTGNGSRDVFVIKGMGNCMHLEEFATPDSPRNGQAWSRLPGPWKATNSDGTPRMKRVNSMFMRTKEVFGFSVGYWMTIAVCSLETILWLALLITVVAIKVNTWFLLAVGALGMFQNAIMAAMERRPDHRGLPLEQVDIIMTDKVMDGLMDLEISHGCGEALLREFFPGKLRPKEKAWWEDKDREEYDLERIKSRTRPRSQDPEYLKTRLSEGLSEKKIGKGAQDLEKRLSSTGDRVKRN